MSTGVFMERIVDIHSFLSAVATARSRFGAGVWWRGHASSAWRLVAGVHRYPGGIGYERNITSRFLHRAKTRHPSCPDPGDFAGWLFFMQHYRLPTRLLDWSESPLVAAFFAVSELPAEGGDLWALCPYSLNQYEFGAKALAPCETPPALQLFRCPFFMGQQPSDSVVAVPCREVDARMMIQLSGFTIHGAPSALEDRPASGRYLMRFHVPAEVKPHIAQELQSLGVRESTLFPDLEHLASELRDAVFIDPGVPQ